MKENREKKNVPQGLMNLQMRSILWDPDGVIFRLDGFSK